MEICSGIAMTPFGPFFMAFQGDTCLASAFSPNLEDSLENFDRDPYLQGVSSKFPLAKFCQANAMVQRIADRLFDPFTTRDAVAEIPLRMPADGFRSRVWHALQQVEFGETLSYSALASRIGNDRAARAVGTAVSRNCFAFLIPCHRVLPLRGDSGNYRWDPDRKRALLDWEKKSSG